jgi:membrane protein
MKLPKPVAIAWTAIEGLSSRNGIEISGYIAFTVMLSLFPFMIFLVAVAGFVGSAHAGADFISTLSLFAPPDVIQTLQPAISQVIDNRSGGLLTIGLVLALYSAASSVSALRLALNLSYQAPETRPFWLRKLQDFGIVIVGSVIVILSSVAIIAGPWLINIIAWFTFVDSSDRVLWHVARYFFVLVVMTAGVIALHRVLPDVRLTLRQILPGALCTTVSWIIAASGLTLYFGKFANYASTYGSLGGVIITLMFFYVSAIIFIFGGELNATLMARTAQPGRLPTVAPELKPSTANI